MSPKDQQNLNVIDQKDNGNGNGNGNGNQTEKYSKFEKKRLHLDERFIVNIKGKDFALYAGLLDLAHQIGLKKLQVHPIQFPTKENGYEAICKAIAETNDGKIFEDIGDANPNNCHTMVSKHILRMSSTRCKSRILRDMTNIGITCIDEIGDPNEIIGNDEYPQEPKPRTRRRRSTKANKESQKETKPVNLPASGSNGGNGSETPNTNSVTESIQNNDGKSSLSKTQYRAILNISHRRGISEEQLDKMCIDMFNKHLQFLDSSEGASMINTLQTSANPLA